MSQISLDPGKLSVAQVRAGLAAKEFSARELAQGALAAIEQRDGDIHAFLQVTDELALQAADAIDAKVAAGEELPLLAGVPVAYKDNMNQIGTRTTCSSRMLEDYESPYTATCVQKTLDAGALPLGKLNMDEFAFGSSTETSAFGPSKNPWDTERVPGGSSGGSAAAIASGMAVATLGSDTGGSIRQPASFCGVVGIKPTYGVVSRYGVVAFGSSLDQVGPFGKSVMDVAETLDAICGHDPLDCTSQPVQPVFAQAAAQGAQSIAGLKVGIVPAFRDAAGITPEVVAAIAAAEENLEKLGAELVEVELPNTNSAISAYYVLGPCEAFSNLSRFDSIRYGHCHTGLHELGERYEASRSEGFGPEAIRRIMLGSYLLSAGVYDKYYYPAQQVRTLITQDFQRAFEKCDVILSPASPRAAFKFGEIQDPTTMYLSDMFTVSINIAGNGGISVPVGLGADSGLPIGAQLIGPQFADEKIVAAAAALETCYGSTGLAPAFEGGLR